MDENFGLLCGENTNSCFGDFDCNASVDFVISSSWHNNQNQIFFNKNGLMGFPVLSEERVIEMVEREVMHLPKQDYLMRLRTGDLDLRIRREAIDWIIKAQTHLSFGAMSVCLSMNYLDRFLSVYELPKAKPWTGQLLAVACFSLAAKLEEINLPSSVDLQVGEPKFMFEAKTIKRMELLVLTTLNWRIQPITPYSFLDYFLIKINTNQNAPNSLIIRSSELILSTIKGIDFLEFRPSEIAAAVAIYVSAEDQTVPPGFDTHFQKERVMKVIELIRDITVKKKGERVRSGRGSPNGVLEAASESACLSLSYKSDDITIPTVGSCNSPDIKRRKQNNYNS